jgi:hypothetical protein
MARGKTDTGTFEFPNKLVHLRHALRLTGPRGMCFHRAVAMVMDLVDAKLCIGTFRAASPEEREANPEFSDVPFIHAWVEWRGKAFAPSAIERTGGLVAMPIDGYRDVNEARDVVEVPRAVVMKLARRYGYARHFKLQEPLKEGARFGGSLLDGVGYPHDVTEDGGVVAVGSAS